MRITLYNIKLFSECPAYYTFLQGIPKKDIRFDINIVQQVIKKCYLVATETGFKATWRRIVSLVNQHVFKDVDTDNDEAFDKAKSIAEHILSFLNRWYEDIYLPEQVMAYVDLKLERELGSHVVADKIPIIKVSAEAPIIMLVNDVARSAWELYNDISIKGLCWLVAKTLDCEEVKVQYICMGKQGGFDFSKFTVNKPTQIRTGEILSQLLQSIAQGVNYPSITEKCYSCPFNRRCQ